MAKTTVPQYLSATTSIIDSGDATAITIDGSENVAIGGGTNHDGAALLVSHGDSGVTTFSDNADELVIENSTNAGISILTPNNASGSIIFGDSDDDDIGKIVYNHNDNSLTLTATTVATSGNATVGGTLGVTGAVTANAGVVVDNITIDGTEIDLSSGDLTVDVAGDIILDADGGDIKFKDGGTDIASLKNSGGTFIIKAEASDSDIYFNGNDGGSAITAMAIDMSEGGKVGIGTATPDSFLHVTDSDSSTDLTDANNIASFERSGNARVVIATGTGNTGSVEFGDSGSARQGRVSYAHSDDSLGFFTAGSERMRIDSSGQVGIRTSSPSDTLEIQSSGNDDGFRLKGSGGDNLVWLHQQATDSAIMRMYDGGTVKVLLNASGGNSYFNGGKVIIGDTASHTTDLLQIETPASGGGHGIQIRRNDANTDQVIGHIMFGNNTDTDLVKISAKTDGDSNAGDSGALLFSTQPTGGSNTERMRIDSSGNVGIGTDSPSTLLTVGDSTGDHYITIDKATTGENGILFKNGGNNKSKIIQDSSEHLRFYVNNTTLAMSILENGNIGIGTTTPSRLLDIASTANNAYPLKIRGNIDNNGGYTGIVFGYESDVTTYEKAVIHVEGTSGNVQPDMHFLLNEDANNSNATLSDAKLSILNGGNVGIGTSTPSYLLHVVQHGAPVNDLTMIRLTNGHGLAGSDLSQQSTHIDFEFKDSNSNVVPQARISAHVGDGGDANTQVKEGQGYLTFHCSNTTTTSGELDPAEHFRIAHDGTLTATDTTIGSNSDKRLKKKIKKYSGGLDLINQLQPRTFEWKAPDKRKQGTRRGFVAQEVLEIDDYWIDEIGLTNKNDPEYKYVKDTEKVYTSKLTDKDAMYVSAIKEMKATIDALEARITELESS